MEVLNFTQFCQKNGFPCDYDTMFNAQLLGGRGLAGSISNRSIKQQNEAFLKIQSENKKAHELFYNMIKNGELIDGSGELTKENILAREKRLNDKETQSKIEIIKGKISFIESLGTLSHQKNGRLKKGYQSQIDEYNEQLNNLINS